MAAIGVAYPSPAVAAGAIALEPCLDPLIEDRGPVPGEGCGISHILEHAGGMTTADRDRPQVVPTPPMMVVVAGEHDRLPVNAEEGLVEGLRASGRHPRGRSRREVQDH